MARRAAKNSQNLYNVDTTPAALVVFVDRDNPDRLRAIKVHLPRFFRPLFTDDHRFTGGFAFCVAIFDLKRAVGQPQSIENR